MGAGGEHEPWTRGGAIGYAVRACTAAAMPGRARKNSATAPSVSTPPTATVAGAPN